MRKVLLLFTLISYTATAQITITSSDVANMFAIGNSATIQEDTLQSSVDIGSPGGGNNWNFTTLQSNFMMTLESIDPATSPHISDFSGANICNYTSSNIGGNLSEVWTYSKLNGQFDVLGNAIENSALPGFLTEIKYDPYRRQYEHPLTLNSQWSDSYTQNTFINGILINSSSVSISSIVDAYGTMTMPGGASYEALRLREELTINGTTTVSFSFLAKNGAQVSVNATSPNPPNSGTINVEGTTYYDGLITSLEQVSELPDEYKLRQNYPNPFNPTTTIKYQIPEAGLVSLRVYDVLGNEIAELVNETKQSGSYEIEFDASGLSSGVYIYKIRSGNFINTKKMVLMK